jgi:hypothetical protein
MKQHRYRITLEHLADAQGNPSSRAPLRFEAGNHDDIIAIVERMQARNDLPLSADSAAALALGLKLFGEVMLENREHPLFAAFRPHYREFIKELKKGSATPAA